MGDCHDYEWDPRDTGKISFGSYPFPAADLLSSSTTSNNPDMPISPTNACYTLTDSVLVSGKFSPPLAKGDAFSSVELWVFFPCPRWYSILRGVGKRSRRWR